MLGDAGAADFVVKEQEAIMAIFSIFKPFIKNGWVLLWAMVVLGCASQERGIHTSGPHVTLFSWGSGIYDAPVPDAEEGEDEEEGPSTLDTLIMYLPNRWKVKKVILFPKEESLTGYYTKHDLNEKKKYLPNLFLKISDT